MRVVAIINPAAGRDEPILSAVSDVLGAADVDWKVRVTTGPGDAERFAKESCEAEVDRILAYGGDGTVSAVAACMAGSSIPLAIIPGGTGNAIAQDLGIPLDVRAAIALAADPAAPVQPIDCLRHSDRRYFLRLGIGADARMIQNADRGAKDSYGWLAYLLAAAGELRDPMLAHYDLELDGEKVEIDALTLILANVGRLGRAGMRLADDVDPSDGWIDVFAIRDGGASSAVAVGAQLLGIVAPDAVDAADERTPVVRWRARHVSVHSDPEQEVQGDGESIGETPLDVRIEPGAVQVVRPLV